MNEYFYGDWEKLKLLVPGFIRKIDIPEFLENECYEAVYEFKTSDEFKTRGEFVAAIMHE